MDQRLFCDEVLRASCRALSCVVHSPIQREGRISPIRFPGDLQMEYCLSSIDSTSHYGFALRMPGHFPNVERVGLQKWIRILLAISNDGADISLSQRNLRS